MQNFVKSEEYESKEGLLHGSWEGMDGLLHGSWEGMDAHVEIICAWLMLCIVILDGTLSQQYLECGGETLFEEYMFDFKMPSYNPLKP
jgi:hypothetical protein